MSDDDCGVNSTCDVISGKCDPGEKTYWSFQFYFAVALVDEYVFLSESGLFTEY